VCRRLLSLPNLTLVLWYRFQWAKKISTWYGCGQRGGRPLLRQGRLLLRLHGQTDACIRRTRPKGLRARLQARGLRTGRSLHFGRQALQRRGRSTSVSQDGCPPRNGVKGRCTLNPLRWSWSAGLWEIIPKGELRPRATGGRCTWAQGSVLLQVVRYSWPLRIARVTPHPPPWLRQGGEVLRDSEIRRVILLTTALRHTPKQTQNPRQHLLHAPLVTHDGCILNFI
jgi:hypothetical protein